jgi:7-cyano-7-deazaguanine synthase
MLVLIHLTRFVGIYFLVLYQRGELPRAFAVPGGIGDIIVATMALPVAFAPLDARAQRRAIVIWNVVGFVDILLVVISATRIYIGAVAEDSSGYPDCRPEFYEAFQQTIDVGTRPDTNIEIVTPIIHLRKSEIIRRGLDLGAPLELTWSCYQSEDTACGDCDSCALRLRAFAEAGVVDPIRYA